MPFEQAVPQDSPLMKAWEAYKKSDEYKNSRKWASTARLEEGDGWMKLTYPHTEGSLWAAFSAGFSAQSIE
jgi:hypothetical protein